MIRHFCILFLFNLIGFAGQKKTPMPETVRPADISIAFEGGQVGKLLRQWFSEDTVSGIITTIVITIIPGHSTGWPLQLTGNIPIMQQVKADFIRRGLAEFNFF